MVARRQQQQRGGEQEQAARDHAIEDIPAIPCDTGKGARGSCRYVACQILGVKGKSLARA